MFAIEVPHTGGPELLDDEFAWRAGEMFDSADALT